MILRAFIAAVLLLLAPCAALANERITDFDVAIEVEKDGDILVTENISVISDSRDIKHGIFRDLPRFYLKGGRRLPYAYRVRRVIRDGEKEPYAIEQDGNAFRIRIGDADVYLDNGPHAYSIVFEVKNQVRYFDGYDEIYWNVTGNFWAFPIEEARARISLPGGAMALQHAAYTGREGAQGTAYVYAFDNGAHAFASTSPFDAGEGMTVAVGFAKGVIDPPSAADARGEWWTVNASRVVLAAAFAVIGLYYVFTWRRVGRDPLKGPVFARYEPPEALSPAAVHYIFHHRFSGHGAFIATLINLAIRKRLKIDVGDDKKTTLTRLGEAQSLGSTDVEAGLEGDLFGSSGKIRFGGEYNPALTSAYDDFRKTVAKDYGPRYFKWNRGFLLFAVALSVGAGVLASKLALEWTGLHSAAVAGLAIMAFAASYFLPAATPGGQKIRTAIEGFRLYLKTAEQLQINAVKVGSDAPPLMTVERYERFLPYAIALGVEKPWTEHFEKLMPKEAAEYRPVWTSGDFRGGRSLSGLNSALVAGISSGVSSSLPKSSSSSGSGGGGSSGGGGGGGGGGGW